jgi:hypothetical protein
MSKHTPGPWTVDRIPATYGEELDYPEVQGFRVPASTYRYDAQRVEANARLMAAAPELLSLVERFVGAMEAAGPHSRVFWGVGGVAQLTEARELMARIEGDV